MYKKSALLLIILLPMLSFGKVGINTIDLQEIFNVDSYSSIETTNLKISSPNPLQASDDFHITSFGSFRIGTISTDPSVKLIKLLKF